MTGGSGNPSSRGGEEESLPAVNYGMHERSLIDNLQRKLLRSAQRRLFEKWIVHTKNMRELSERKRLELIVDNARKVLQAVGPGKRTVEHINTLKLWAYEIQSRNFKNTDAGAVEDVLSNMEFISYNDSDLIFLQGDFGTHYYIIFSGKVAIFAGAPASSILEIKADRKEAAAKYDLKGEFLGIRVATVPTGAGFGEVALFEDGIRRTASAVADGFVEMIAVPKLLYRRSFAQYHVEAMEQTEKTSFMSKNRYFSGWPHHRLITVSKLLSKKKYRIGDSLLVEGERTPNVIFIRVGEVKLVKDVMIDPTATQPLSPSPSLLSKGSHPATSPTAKAGKAASPGKSTHKAGSPGKSSGVLGSPPRQKGPGTVSMDISFPTPSSPAMLNALNSTLSPGGANAIASHHVAGSPGGGRRPHQQLIKRNMEIAIICAGEVVGNESLAQAGLPLRYSAVASSNVVEVFILPHSEIRAFQNVAKGTNSVNMLIHACKLRINRHSNHLAKMEKTVTFTTNTMFPTANLPPDQQKKSKLEENRASGLEQEEGEGLGQSDADFFGKQLGSAERGWEETNFEELLSSQRLKRFHHYEKRESNETQRPSSPSHSSSPSRPASPTRASDTGAGQPSTPSPPPARPVSSSSNMASSRTPSPPQRRPKSAASVSSRPPSPASPSPPKQGEARTTSGTGGDLLLSRYGKTLERNQTTSPGRSPGIGSSLTPALPLLSNGTLSANARPHTAATEAGASASPYYHTTQETGHVEPTSMDQSSNPFTWNPTVLLTSNNLAKKPSTPSSSSFHNSFHHTQPSGISSPSFHRAYDEAGGKGSSLGGSLHSGPNNIFSSQGGGGAGTSSRRSPAPFSIATDVVFHEFAIDRMLIARHHNTAHGRQGNGQNRDTRPDFTRAIETFGRRKSSIFPMAPLQTNSFGGGQSASQQHPSYR